MRSLIWCEWRTRRLWLIALVASVIVPILLGNPLSFWGGYASVNDAEGWFYVSDSLLPSMIISLLFGLMAFSGELGAGVQDFLLSRPVSWKKLLAAKLVVGLGMIVVSALLALVAFRLVCPEQYLPFLNSSKLAGGLVGAIAAMGLWYIVGMACSVVLPGAVGAVLMILVVPVTAFVLLLAFTTVMEMLGMSKASFVAEISPLVVVLPWLVGITCAALVAIRFGLTLSVAQRIRRYALVALTTVACVSVITMSLHKNERNTETGYRYNFSPDLSHAIVQVDKRAYASDSKYDGRRMLSSVTNVYFRRISDGVTRDISQFTYAVDQMRWLNNTTPFIVRSAVSMRNITEPASITTVDLDESGNVQIKDSTLDNSGYSGYPDSISPDGRTALFAAHFRDEQNRVHRELRFWDIKNRRWLAANVQDNLCWNGEWWQSSAEFAWLDENDVRHVIRVR